MSSCSAMTRSISASILRSYPALSMSPERMAARARRTSPVCGKEPMVVVASTGSSSYTSATPAAAIRSSSSA